ncbi:hypothetical protein JAAARDRAFT_33284 [Jaapia argillacea MUCL 33604]|uniref:F-box domain-containing protein n=1 Tax=Jaapia argillacea MUCL 33604 TaxID=933084 RepID=A0A067PYC2_9AGAM|nr:hypothetical protein JAAARDRAFT_33284 [Jaapia argillacea MUCL 33604]
MSPPIDSLPTELLVIAFHMAIKSPFHPNPISLDFLLPLRLSHVSKRFRALIIHTPSLWTTIFVDLTKSSRLQFLSNLYLERSFPLPFDLEIRAYGKPGAHIDGVLDIFTRQIDRCHSLSVHTHDGEHFMQIASSFLQFPAPSLQYLEFRVFRIITSIHLQELFKGIAPSLMRIRLQGLILEGWDPSILSNLSTLEIGGWLHQASCEEWRNILTNSTSLENLILRSVPSRFFVNTPPPIPIPSLRSLTLTSSFNYTPVFQIISVLSTPSLESLVLIQGHPAWENTGWSEFICQAARHRAEFPLYSKLRSLALSGVPLGRVGRAFIGAFPGITHLSVACIDVKPILHTLVPSREAKSWNSKSLGLYDEDDVPWPALGHLTLDSLDVPTRELHQVLRTRIEYGCPISEVFVRVDRKLDEYPEALRWDGMGGTLIREIVEVR